jgi:ankyrin repeat protein
MTLSSIPDRASLEFLKKRAKERLVELRQRNPSAKLADAQLAIAREYGFASWRALKAEIDRRRVPAVTAFFAACQAGDTATLRELLASDPVLVHERNAGGGTGLHLAVAHLEAVKLLLDHGADPNARESGDNAYPLHFAGGAVGAGGVEVVRALLDAGADVHGVGDVHQLDVIGWATCFGATPAKDIVALLLERGARHHIFSAIAMRDLELIQRIVAENPDALARRLSPFENRQTALHYVIAPPDGLLGGGFRTGEHYAMLDLLIELGADLEAEDDKGRTPLAVAMLRGDSEAMRRLQAAGARIPIVDRAAQGAAGAAGAAGATGAANLAGLASSIKRVDPMLPVANVRATVEWYQALGFTLEGAHEIDTDAAWAGMSLGGCYVMFIPSGGAPPRRPAVSFWFRTDRVDDLYQVLKRRQLERASMLLAGETPETPEVRFTSDIHNAFYGERQFSVVDPNGYELNFCQPID